MACDELQRPEVDVLIVGAGPAGRWLAALLVRRGVSVILVDPVVDRKWENTYGVWTDRLRGLELNVDLKRRWSSPVVRFFGGAQERRLRRCYGQIDGNRFRDRLDAVMDSGQCRRLAAVGKQVIGDGDASRVVLGDGAPIGAKLVVDASGGAAGWVRCDRSKEPGFQTAYGLDARFRGDPLKGASMVLMDLCAALGADGRDMGEPSFLYGMHRGGERYFVEETALVARPAVSMDVLKRRLHARLRQVGAKVVEVFGEEHCKIPMGTGPPAAGQPVVAFGAAAGFVHPATGYQMAKMLRMGPEVADVMVAGLRRGLPGDAIARRVGEVMWPAPMRRAYELLCFGMEVLLNFDQLATSRFFGAFFGLPDSDWRAYMSGEAGPDHVAKIMWRVFRRVPMRMRYRLGRRALAEYEVLRNALWSRDTPAPEDVIRSSEVIDG